MKLVWSVFVCVWMSMYVRERNRSERGKERERLFSFSVCLFECVCMCVCDVHMCEQSLNGACGQVPVLFFSISIVYFFLFETYSLTSPRTCHLRRLAGRQVFLLPPLPLSSPLGS